VFQEKSHEQQNEFHALNPTQWESPSRILPGIGFVVIWPTEALLTDDGATIIHIVTAAPSSSISFATKNQGTHEESGNYEIAQFPIGDRIETVARISFTGKGKYSVTAFGGVKRQLILDPLDEMVYGRLGWRFDVEGAQPAKRPLKHLIAHWKVERLICTDSLVVIPGDSVVIITTLRHQFACKLRGSNLVVNGREAAGEREQLLFL
jgi:hypothetical protein